MAAQTLPCAAKKCASKMSLIEDKDGFLYYRCLEKHNAHYFRYDLTQKQWERLIVTRKLLISFKEDPYGQSALKSSTKSFTTTDAIIDGIIIEPDVPSVEPVKDVVDSSVDRPVENEPLVSEVSEETESDLMKIKGIDSRVVKELGAAGVHAVSDLAGCSAAALSEETKIPMVKLLTWIVKAKTLTEEQVPVPA